MPKVKKNKIVSLVAYESGAESENESVNESSEESESSGEENEDVQMSEEETQTAKFTKKSSEPDETQEILNEDTRSNNSSSKISQPNEAITEKIETETQNSITIESSASSSSIDSKYTIENGFPPGCSSIKIPPPPSAPCSQALQNKIIQVIDRMDKYNYSINDDIYRKKQFKNPSIYEKLIEVYGVDEYGSNFPDHIENLKASGYSFYDELNEIQMQSWAKLDKEKQAKTKVEVVSGVKKK